MAKGRGEQREFWHQHVRAWRQSGQRREGYCQEHGLNPQTFVNVWVGRLREEFRSTDSQSNGADGDETETFVPVEVTPEREAASATGTVAPPIEIEAGDATLRVAQDEIRGCDPETRKAVRQEKSKPLLDDFDAWLEARLGELPPKSDLAKAFQRIRASWPSLTVFPDDGRVELDSNRVETLICLVALTRKNALFAGDQAGGHTWAIIQSLAQTCKLNGVEHHSAT